jgi:hypothetical protein
MTVTEGILLAIRARSVLHPGLHGLSEVAYAPVTQNNGLAIAGSLSAG